MLGKSGQNDVQFPWGYFVASLLPIKLIGAMVNVSPYCVGSYCFHC